MKKVKKSQIGQELFKDVANLIDETRKMVAYTVNSALTYMYWKIGKRINEEVLQYERAEYGSQIVATLSRQLQDTYGKGFEEKNLRRMMKFSSVFQDEAIVASVMRQLSWTHIIMLLPLKDPLQREFYTEICKLERWSVRTLRKKIDGMLYERTAISRKPDELIRQEIAGLRNDGILTPDLVFRDPYFLNFAGLKDTYSEKSLEDAIIRELEAFILELGCGFAFIERQKRMIIDGEDFKVDLLFFHRKLKRLIAIDFKLGKFKAEYKSQMELYLRWLEKYEMQQDEETPLGLILCEKGSKEQIELLQLDKAGIRVAEYLTELPDKKLLLEKLHQVIKLAKGKLENKEDNINFTELNKKKRK
jgi:predicted nuclease of restriction endonuclease-like (RecB) superfamily